MALSDELEKLARLRDRGVLSTQEFAQAKARLLAGPAFGAGVRRQSATRIAGLPLWAIATGPDPDKGEWRGHARGIVAIGDMATGVLAFGGLARGVVAFGGLAVGLFSFGGMAVGLMLAMGGAAIGGVAVGGGAVGETAIGGGAAGAHVISATRCDPEAVAYFRERFAWLPPAQELLDQATRQGTHPACSAR